MKHANGNLGRALAKVKHFADRVWCGAVTASEACALIEAGAAPSAGWQWWVEAKQSGDSQRRWFYFTPTGELKRLIGERHGM